MKKIRTYLALVLIIAMMATLLTGCGTNGDQDANAGGEGEPYVFKIGTVSGEAHPTYDVLREMEKRIEERSEGRIDVQYYPGSQLGGEVENYEGCIMGTIEGVCAGAMALSNFTDALVFLQLPFLFNSKEAALEFFDSEYGEMVAQRIEDEVGIKTWFLDDGCYDIASINKQIKTPADFKGLKLRCQEVSLFVDAFNALNAQPVPMAYAEVYTGLQQGTISATTANPLNLYANNYYEICGYYNRMNMFQNVLVFGCNAEWFNSLPEDLQIIMDEEMSRVTYETYGRQLGELEDEYLNKVSDKMETITYTADELAAFKEIVSPLYDTYTDKYNEPNFDVYMSAIDEINAKYAN